MKKIIYMLITVIIILSAVAGCTRDLPLFEYEFDEENAGIRLTAYLGGETQVTVPETIKGKPIVGISSTCFAAGDVTDVSVPGTLKYFEWGDRKSESFNKITFLKIPDGVTKITDNAFKECHSLIDVVIPDSVTEIGDGAFMSCYLLSSVRISENVTKISEDTFYLCPSLTTVNIPDRVTEIGECAFHGCTSLAEIRLPDSLTEIKSSAFQDCISLSNINIPDNSTEIGVNAFYGCRLLLDEVIQRISESNVYAY